MPSTTFSFTGALQQFTVPAGVTNVQLEAWGAQGGYKYIWVEPGLGGYARRTLAVSPSDVLDIYVGGRPTEDEDPVGGWPDGGDALFGAPFTRYSPECGTGGGGSTRIQDEGTTNDAGAFLIAGGGGGCGGDPYEGTTDPPNGGAGGFLDLEGNGGPVSFGNPDGVGQGGGASDQYGTDGEAPFIAIPAGYGSNYPFGGGGGGGGGYRGGTGGSHGDTAIPEFRGSGGGGGSNYLGTTNTPGTRIGNGLVKVTWSTPPNAPTNLRPLDSASVTTDTPTLYADFGTHPDGGGLTQRAHFQISNVSDFTSGVTSYYSAYYTSKTDASAVVTDGDLSTGTWYIRARVEDATGNVSSWTSTNTFSILHQPSVANLTPSGGEGRDGDQSITLSWDFTDPSPTDTQSTHEVEIREVAGMTTIYQPGETSSSNEYVMVSIAEANQNVELQWRVRVKDSDGTQSAWSAWNSFYAWDVPVMTITSHTEDEVIGENSPTILWTGTLPNRVFVSQTFRAYRIENDGTRPLIYSRTVSSVPNGTQGGGSLLAWGVYGVGGARLENGDTIIVVVSGIDDAGMHTQEVDVFDDPAFYSNAVTLVVQWDDPPNPSILVTDNTPVDGTMQIELSEQLDNAMAKTDFTSNTSNPIFPPFGDAASDPDLSGYPSSVTLETPSWGGWATNDAGGGVLEMLFTPTSGTQSGDASVAFHGAATNGWIACSELDMFIVSAFVKEATNDPDHNDIYIEAEWFNSSESSLSTDAQSARGWADLEDDGELSGYRRLAAEFIAPTNAAFVQFRFVVDPGGGQLGGWHFRDPRFEYGHLSKWLAADDIVGLWVPYRPQASDEMPFANRNVKMMRRTFINEGGTSDSIEILFDNVSPGPGADIDGESQTHDTPTQDWIPVRYGMILEGTLYAKFPDGASSPGMAFSVLDYDESFVSLGAGGSATIDSTDPDSTEYPGFKKIYFDRQIDFDGYVRPRINGSINGSNLGDTILANPTLLVRSRLDGFISYQVYRRPTLDRLGNPIVADWELIYTHEDSFEPIGEYFSFKDPLVSAGYTYEYAVTQTAEVEDSIIESAIVAAATVLASDTKYWLLSVENPSLNTPLWHVIGDESSDEIESEELNLSGRGRQVSYGDVLGDRGTLTAQLRDIDRPGLEVSAREQRSALDQMRENRYTVYLRNPFGDLYKVALDTMTSSKVPGAGPRDFQDVTLAYREVL